MPPASPPATRSLPPVVVSVMTAPAAGAIAVVQLSGLGVAQAVTHLTGQPPAPRGVAVLRRIDDLDEAVVVLLRDNLAQVMPHGGTRVMQQVVQRLLAGGAELAMPDAVTAYPEAGDPLEAAMLATLAQAASPAAVDLLLAQPALWRAYLARDGRTLPPLHRQPDTTRDPSQPVPPVDPFDLLIRPPTVVVIGRPNVGKSTLSNALMGRQISLTADLPGTTRDWVRGTVELSLTGDPVRDAVTVHWLDTPGLRDTDDAIEAQAITQARNAIACADLRIMLRDPDTDWPDPQAVPEPVAPLPQSQIGRDADAGRVVPTLWVVNKADQPGQPPAGTTVTKAAREELWISARTGAGLGALERAVLRGLRLADLTPRRWAFVPELRGL